MATKGDNPDMFILLDLARQAQSLLQKFLDLPISQQARSKELRAEFENVLRGFKRRRPPRLLCNRQPFLRSIDRRRICAICLLPIEPQSVDHIETVRCVYHVSCLHKADNHTGIQRIGHGSKNDQKGRRARVVSLRTRTSTRSVH
jgi:hypothetical protein